MQVFNIHIPDSVVDEIIDYVDMIAEESIPNALKWYQDIESTINTLQKTPKRCPLASETIFHDFEIRHLIFGNYRILFRIKDNTVQILHVKHARMERTNLY